MVSIKIRIRCIGQVYFTCHQNMLAAARIKCMRYDQRITINNFIWSLSPRKAMGSERYPCLVLQDIPVISRYLCLSHSEHPLNCTCEITCETQTLCVFKQRYKPVLSVRTMNRCKRLK